MLNQMSSVSSCIMGRTETKQNSRLKAIPERGVCSNIKCFFLENENAHLQLLR